MDKSVFLYFLTLAPSWAPIKMSTKPPQFAGLLVGWLSSVCIIPRVLQYWSVHCSLLQRAFIL